MSNSVESDFSTAVTILGAASALVLAIVAFIPVDTSFHVPPDLYLGYQFLSGVAWLFIAFYIAVRSYQNDTKSKSKTFRLAGVTFFLGFMAAISLFMISEKWVIHDPGCIDPATGTENRAFSTLIAPATIAVDLQAKIRQQSPRIETGAIAAALPRFICEDEVGADVRRMIEATNDDREAVILLIMVTMATGLFTGLTLLLWTLVALKPVERQAPTPDKPMSLRNDMVAMLRRMFGNSM